MSDSLRDQLLGLGFKSAPKAQPKPKPHPKPHAWPHPGSRPQRDARRKPPGEGASRRREDIDLAKAYAIRAQREKDERIEAERRKQ